MNEDDYLVDDDVDINEQLSKANETSKKKRKRGRPKKEKKKRVKEETEEEQEEEEGDSPRKKDKGEDEYEPQSKKSKNDKKSEREDKKDKGKVEKSEGHCDGEDKSEPIIEKPKRGRPRKRGRPPKELSLTKVATDEALSKKPTEMQQLNISDTADILEGKKRTEPVLHSVGVDLKPFIVPEHCSWFDLHKIHEIEEEALPEFFDDSSETKTPELSVFPYFPHCSTIYLRL